MLLLLVLIELRVTLLFIYFFTQGVAFVDIIPVQLPVTTHGLVILWSSPQNTQHK